MIDQPTGLANGIFVAIVILTLGISWWASRLSWSRETFYAAGQNLSPWKNGLAIAGDFMSAATFLGITGALYFVGIDAYIMAVGIMVGWPIMLMLVAERFRNLGRFTFIDVLCYRLDQRPIRIIGALVSLCIVLFYLVAQLVGAGTLIELLFNIKYPFATSLVGALMVICVAFGGMFATTWVQLIKAILLLLAGTYLAFEFLQRSDFSIPDMLSSASMKHSLREQVTLPGQWLNGDWLSVGTIGLTMAFGVVGLPHVLMRFFTVKDSIAARQSVFIATSAMGYFYLLIFIIGFGSIIVIGDNPDIYFGKALNANMIAIHASSAVGGGVLQGLIAAVCFSTILAVVAGLTLSGVATVTYDLYANVRSEYRQHDTKRTETIIARFTAFSIGVIAVILSLLFEGQNVAFIAAFALAVAASVNFPLIILSMYWKGMTTRGALVGASAGLVLSVVLVVSGPGVMVQVLEHEAAWFPYDYPTIVSMPFTFIVIVVVSAMDRSERAKLDREAFEDQVVRSEIGDTAKDGSLASQSLSKA